MQNEHETDSILLSSGSPTTSVVAVEGDEDGAPATATFEGDEPVGNSLVTPIGEEYDDAPERFMPDDHDASELAEESDGRYAITQSEVIIGTDDRKRITNTNSWPWRVHGHMIMTFPNGKRYIGSGTLINRHHVLTAGHCIHSKQDGGWARSVVFIPGQNDNSKPYGAIWATRLVSAIGWTSNANRNYDYGMLVLSSDVGKRTGWFGIITTSDKKLLRKRVNLSGYPGDKGGRQQWWHADVIKQVGSRRVIYDIDTMGGQSGSGVWAKFSGFKGEKVAAIHTTGSSSGNGATRINRPVFDNYVKWMSTW